MLPGSKLLATKTIHGFNRREGYFIHIFLLALYFSLAHTVKGKKLSGQCYMNCQQASFIFGNPAKP